MLPLTERLRLALERNPRLSQAGLARATGAKSASVSNWFTGKSLSLKAANLRKAAGYLGCSQHWLETGIGDPGWTDQQAPSGGLALPPVAQEMSAPYFHTGPITANQVPVIGTLAMGADKMYELRTAPDGRPIGHVPAYSNKPGSYAVRVFGDELYPAVRHGACLVVEPGGHCHEGELVLVETRDGYYLVCELVALRDDTVTFVPANGGARRTLDRSTVAAVHPVVDITAASRFEPGTGQAAM